MTRSRVVGCVLYVLTLFLASRALHAFSSGISGWSGDPIVSAGNNCNVCHEKGIAPTVTLSGPTVVGLGETNTYMLKVSGGQVTGGGLDVAAADGMLSVADPGTQLLDSEITHTAPRPVDGNQEVVWTFNWTAPLVPANTALYAAGNSVDLNGTRTGDQASSIALAIAVGGGTPTPGETSGPDLAPLRVTDYDPGTGDLSISYGTSCESTDTNIYYGPLDQIATLAYDGAWCFIGTSGAYAGFNPGSDSFFFLVVGTKGLNEGSYGKNRLSGGSQNERTPDAAHMCGQLQSLANRCD